MFTGIVVGTARVVDRFPIEQGSHLVLDLDGLAGEVRVGESIAINGTCLTVVERDGERLGFDLAGETIRCTNLGDLSAGSLANVEHALRLGDRLDGHLVQGHVDGVGVLRRFAPEGDDWWLEIEASPEILEQMIHKGSIAVDGISLTIAKLDGEMFASTIIPHTRDVTNLRESRPGDRVNLEVDMVGKWVKRILEPHTGS